MCFSLCSRQDLRQERVLRAKVLASGSGGRAGPSSSGNPCANSPTVSACPLPVDTAHEADVSHLSHAQLHAYHLTQVDSAVLDGQRRHDTEDGRLDAIKVAVQRFECAHPDAAEAHAAHKLLCFPPLFVVGQ